MDLLAVVLATLLAVPFIYGFSLGPLRVVLGLLLALFLPGYVLLALLFPRKGQLEGVERLALSLGLSLAVVPLLGLLLNFTPWGVRLTPIVVAVGGWNLTLAGLAWLQRRRLSPQERYEVRWDPLLAWLRQPRHPVDWVLGALVALSALALVGAIVWRVQNPPRGEPFTEFYVLGIGGKAQDYPTRLRVGEPQEYTLGIINQEQRETTYTVRALLDGVPVGSLGPIVLEEGGKWEGSITVIPPAAGERQKLEFLLYREGDAAAYRTLHLWVEVRAR